MVSVLDSQHRFLFQFIKNLLRKPKQYDLQQSSNT